ncbi:MAG TPA: DNA primase small subunit PriS [Thermoplasmata archaeon]|nr:DNA primase small subunit PriS [Thermoplasmata archaeon]
MGKTAVLAAADLAFARGEFARYYRAHEVPPPGRFTRREFAAFPFATETVMRRHAAFPSADRFHEFLKNEVPRHVYYSSAYYQRPEAPKMVDKGWVGADLIFDLDADHLRDAEKLDYVAQLQQVKRRFRQLLDDFLFGDFGIDPAQVTLVFSGGRGYHVHVHEPGFLGLTSPERRELVEYILGIGLDPKRAVRSERPRDPVAYSLDAGEGGGAESGTGRGSPRRAFQGLADPSSPGWPGRISRAVLELLARWEQQGVDVATEELVGLGMKRAVAQGLARKLIGERRAEWIRKGLSVEVFRGTVPESFLEAVLRHAAVEVQGETDAPVTTDIHRLIRLPDSLHGGTGLMVRPLTRDGLDDFEPLRDAVVDDTGRAPVEVVPAVTRDYPWGEGRIELREGVPIALSASAALFAVLRGEAAVTPA